MHAKLDLLLLKIARMRAKLWSAAAFLQWLSFLKPGQFCLQRSFSSLSNASSDPASEPSVVYATQSGSATGGNLGAGSGCQLASAGHSGQAAGFTDTHRYVHGAWTKAMPPSGKKKKDASSHKAAMARLI